MFPRPVALLTRPIPNMRLIATPLLLATLASTIPAGATLNRGVWFWGDAGSPYGSVNIVGVAAKENATISFLSGHGVKRLYGSYQNRPVTEPVTIRAWNAKLHAAGIDSQCLFSDSDRIFPSLRAELLSKIEERVILFQTDPVVLPVAEQFDGIHLDLEPQALPGWSALGPLEKREWLFHLRDTYAEIRNLLAGHGLPDFPVFADLPVWFDKLPGDGGQIGWLDAADRDLWFDEIMVSLTGVTLMPFQQSSYSAIANSMSSEHSLVEVSRIRVGHLCDVGETWANYGQFLATLYWLESTYGGRAADIQSYRRWRESLPLLPLSAAPLEIALDPIHGGGGSGGVVVHPGGKGTFVLLESDDLCRWREISRFRTLDDTPVRVPVTMSGSRRFWRALEISNPSREGATVVRGGD